MDQHLSFKCTDTANGWESMQWLNVIRLLMGQVFGRAKGNRWIDVLWGRIFTL